MGCPLEPKDGATIDRIFQLMDQAEARGHRSLLPSNPDAEYLKQMPRRSSHPFDALAERFAQIFAERVSAALPKAGRNGVARKAGGLKRDMSCRYPDCKNRSKGPRFRFLCEEHLKLPKKKQDEVLAKWSEKNG